MQEQKQTCMFVSYLDTLHWVFGYFVHRRSGIIQKKNLVAKTKAECSVTSEWSPDGRHFMTATTAPRLQIDNGIKIFDHNGSLQFKKMFEKLYQAD